MKIEQIKKIAEEYAEDSYISPEFIPQYKGNAVHFLKWLSKYYCITKKEEVMRQHQAYVDNKKGCGVSKYDYWDGRVDALENLFGYELFKNN